MDLMHTTAMALFRCEKLSEPLTPANDQLDACGSEWVAELPPFIDGYDGWPVCECGRRAHLVTPYVPAT
jgi:hypothetical protein